MQVTTDGTCLLSLPKNWTKRFNLKKGSSIYVCERADGCLVLDPQYAVDISPETTIKVSEQLEDNILSSYLSGFEIVMILSPKMTEATKERIKRAINRLIGVEIIEEDAQRVVLQCLLKASAFSPDKILRREYILSSSMHKDAVTAFLKLDVALARSIQERDEEVDRLYFLLVRLLRSLILNPRLSEKLNVSLIDCLDYRLISSLIENIADQAVKIAECVLGLKQHGLPEETLSLVEKVGEGINIAYDEVIKALFSKEEKILTRAHRKLDTTTADLKRLETILKTLHPQVSPPLYTMLSIINRVVDCLTDILDLVTPLQN